MRRLLHFFGIHHWTEWRLDKTSKWADVDDYLEKDRAKKYAVPHDRLVRQCKICKEIDEMIV